MMTQAFNDGNVVIYKAEESGIWSTGTHKFICLPDYWDLRCFSGPQTFPGKYAGLQNVKTKTYVSITDDLYLQLVTDTLGNWQFNINRYEITDGITIQNVAKGVNLRMSDDATKLTLTKSLEDKTRFILKKTTGGAEGYILQNFLSKKYLRVSEDGKTLVLVPEDDSVHGDWMRFYIL